MKVSTLTLVETAGAIHGETPHVYMAGSMGREGSDWRQGWRPQPLPDVRADEDLARAVFVAEGGFFYTGPFGDDMGNHSASHGLDFGLDHAEAIFRRSLAGIRAADFVVALVDADAPDCYGTMAEIGYAHGLGIPVYMVLVSATHAEGVCVDPGYAEPLWFLMEMTQQCLKTRPYHKGKAIGLVTDLGIADWAKRRQRHAD